MLKTRRSRDRLIFNMVIPIIGKYGLYIEIGPRWCHVGLYSETTWAVGIAQLTHHEVQGGGKNPETEGRGIFAPTANRVVS